MLKADFMDRGVPWARLLAEQSALVGPSASRTRSLSLRSTEKSNTFFVCLGILLLFCAAWWQSTALTVSGLSALLLVVLRSFPLHVFFYRKRGLLFSLAAVGLHLLYYVTAAVSVVWGALLNFVIGEPRPDPSVEAFSELNLAAWPPIPRNPSKQVVEPETVDR
jgi:hypothetical protein